MKKIFKIVFLVIVMTPFSSYSEWIGPCNFKINKERTAIIRWNKIDFPIPFYVHESVPDPAHHIFIASLNHWNEKWTEYLKNKGVSPFPLFTAPHPNKQYKGEPEFDGWNMLFFMKDIDLEKVETLAFESSLNIGGRIIESDILVHAKLHQHRFFYDPKFIKGSYLDSHPNSDTQKTLYFLKKQLKNFTDFLNIFPIHTTFRQIAMTFSAPLDMRNFASIMIHELGHTLGLTHYVPEGTASMMTKKHKNNRHISEYDLNNLYCAYVENYK